jgi:membrane protein implicated in regulation of membrane protease activity
MDPWVIWLLAAVALALGEMATTSFFLGPFAIAALAAAAVELAGGGSIAAWVVFAVASVAMFALVRPIARRHLRQAPGLRSGTAALIGRSAQVLERISNDDNAGAIRLEGEIWTARAFEDDRVFEPGERVAVIEIRGATALVTDV